MKFETFAKFQSLLVQESGLRISIDDIDSFEKKLLPRMKACHVKAFESYLDYLFVPNKGKKELRHLIDDITVGETYFFRNKPHFDAFSEYVIPALIEKKADRDLRIWCAGCSSGEEPYSIALLLREIVPAIDEWNIRILATDINDNSLEVAREALYSERAVRYVPSDYLSRYFVKEGKRYRLIDGEIKEMVLFQHHNLARDASLLPGMLGLDIIFCRNVLIYFDEDVFKNIISRFVDCLLPDGFLFIGHSETLWGVESAFRVIEFPNTFIYQKTEEKSEPYTWTPLIPLPAAVPDIGVDTGEEPEAMQPSDDVQEGFRALKRKDYEVAMKVFDLHLKGNPDDIKVLMARGVILSNTGDYEGALCYFAKVVQVDNLYAPAYYFIGVLSAKRGRYEEAIEGFRKTLYINPELAVCYFHLGNIHKYLKMQKQAKKEYNNCLNLLDEKDGDESVLLSDELTVEVLRQAVFRALEGLTK